MEQSTKYVIVKYIDEHVDPGRDGQIDGDRVFVIWDWKIEESIGKGVSFVKKWGSCVNIGQVVGNCGFLIITWCSSFHM